MLRNTLLCVRIAPLFLLAATAATAAGTPEGVELFEREIRPLLAENCYACHSAKAASVFAGLRLDSRASLIQGSDTGPVVSEGDAAGSKLMKALRGEIAQMPPTGKLAPEKLDSVARWIDMGLPWPDEAEPAAPAAPAAFDLEERRDNHWAWQPVRVVEPPQVNDQQWPASAVDRFVLAELERKALEPAAPADRATLIRRLTFDLTGLPPKPEQIEAFVNDRSPDAYDKLIDRLLESPRFGEHFARHWMDLMRYAESHGSEGDPDTPEAWQYRDYLIRAFNADVPYDQLVREHLAGDLLENPRINPEDHLNESVIGTAHFRLVEHGFQPVDPWEDRVKWMDNQIDVFSKAFQGMTVSCARCHDHKFDAISQKDFYALFGAFKGARPTQRAIDDPAFLNLHRDQLTALKSQIKDQLVASWLAKAEQVSTLLTEGKLSDDESQAWGLESPLHAWALLRDLDGDAFRQGWESLESYWTFEMAERRKFNESRFDLQWDLSRPQDYAAWLRHGVGAPEAPSKAGEFQVTSQGDRFLSGIYPAGVYTHLLSAKHNGVVQSPRFTIDSDYISFRMLGGNFPFARLIVENYAVPRAGIYHMRYSPKSDQMAWTTWKTDYWKGFTAYLEYTTLQDSTNFLLDAEDSQKRPQPKPNEDGRSYFGAAQVVFHDQDGTPRELNPPIIHLLDSQPPANRAELATLYQRLLGEAIAAWRDGKLDERQAAFLDFFVRSGLLPSSVSAAKPLQPLVAEYRRLEEEIPVPRRAPGVLEEPAPPQPLLIRGNHKNPGDPVAKHFLSALGGKSLGDDTLVRLRLADDVADARNPLTSRVMVNRLWGYLFGRGIVATVDNFGKLGDAPTHPELLDYLADRFVKEGWSIKKMLRLLAGSQAYRMSSDPSEAALASDPQNKLLQHMPVRRLEAEAIRDSLLAISGRFDDSMYGKSIPVYVTFGLDKTKAKNQVGPLDGNGRRAVYQEIRRNATNPFLEVFDLPKPASTRGKRDSTNVPAQSLTMLNSPFVIGQAEVWSKQLVEGPYKDETERVEYMFVKALGRKPSATELDRAETYLSTLARDAGADQSKLLSSPKPWQDLAQSLFNLKEFLYIR